MNATIAKLDAEIATAQAAIVQVEHALPTIADRYADAEAQLRAAEDLYKTRGLRISAPHPAEAAHLERQVLIGACMVAGGDKLLKTERARIEAQGEGLTAIDRARKLDELRRAIQRAAAKRELAVREIEADDFMDRPVLPQFFLYAGSELERLAAGR
jgi:hypothetical protein